MNYISIEITTSQEKKMKMKVGFEKEEKELLLNSIGMVIIASIMAYSLVSWATL